jgi:cytoskeleton protein RodZ
MQEETVSVTTKGPGEKLRLARESLGLSVWEAASQLYLPERVMRALEEDDYHANLPARAFVRGYLRSYSKLLKLSPEEILSEFDALGIYKTPQEETIKTLSQPRVPVAIHRDKFWFTVVGGSLLAVLVLIVALTWMNTRQEKTEDVITQALQEEVELTTAENTDPTKTGETLAVITPENTTIKSPELEKKAETPVETPVETVSANVPVSVTPIEQATGVSPVVEQGAPSPVAQLSVN